MWIDISWALCVFQDFTTVYVKGDEKNKQGNVKLLPILSTEEGENEEKKCFLRGYEFLPASEQNWNSIL